MNEELSHAFRLDLPFIFSGRLIKPEFDFLFELQSEFMNSPCITLHLYSNLLLSWLQYFVVAALEMKQAIKKAKQKIITRWKWTP